MSQWPIVAVIGEFAAKLALIVFIVLRRPPRPTTLVWVVLILALPVVGLVAYLLVGETRLSRHRIARHAAVVGRLRALRASDTVTARQHASLPDLYRPIATLAEVVGDTAPMAGNEVRLIGDTEGFVEALVADIDGAERHCHLLFYIFLDDGSGRRVAESLLRAAGRGVECRLLIDAVGSHATARSPLRRELEAGGVRVVEALPANPLRLLFARLDLRNHRKIAVIDGVIGYMGSQNIADAAFAPKPRSAPWVDASARIQGPVARQLQMLFVEDWYLDTSEALEAPLDIHAPARPDGVPAQVMGTGPNSYNEALRQLHLSAFHAAREELVLTTPYFVPDDATATALRTAARRGVDTMVIVPARNDSPLVAAASRSHYAALLEAGVRIFEYRRGLLHSKTLTIDHDLALIGSANLDRRSFELNFEVSMLVYDTDFASELRFLQGSYLGDSTAVEEGRWRRRRWPGRLWQNAAGMLSPVL